MVPALKSTVYEETAYAEPQWARPRRRWSSTPRRPPARKTPVDPAVRPHTRRRPMSPFVVLLVVGLLLLGVGMGFVAQRVQVMTMGYALAEARQELVQLEQEHARLTAEVARSRSLERIETLARTRLGMVDADPAASIVMVSPQRVATPGAAPMPTGASAPVTSSPLAAFSDWLHARFSTTAEAGSR